MTLARPNYKETVNVVDANNADIITVLEKNFPVAVGQTKDFAKKFKSGSAGEAALKVWDFVKRNIKYQRDDDEKQAIRLPNRFVNDRTGDCKSYALFIASVLQNLGYTVAFRYTSYNRNNPKPSHVYVYLPDDGIVVDGVYNYFNKEKPFVYKYDHTMVNESINMEVVTLSDNVGINASLIRAYKRSKKGSLRQRLLANEIARKSNRRYKPVSESLLKQKIKLVSPGSSDYILAMKELDAQGVYEVDGINGIGKIRVKKFLKKVGKGIKKTVKKVGKAAGNVVKEAGKAIKKVGLAVPRNAFLSLVRLNVRGLATNLDYSLANNRSALLGKWKKLGGKSSALINSVNAGKKKKRIFGIEDADFDGLGIEPGSSTAALIASAAPILIGLAVFLKAVKKGDKSSATDILQAAEGAGVDFNQAAELLATGQASYENGYSDEPGDGGSADDNGGGLPPADGGGSGASFSPSPGLLLGAGLLVAVIASNKN